MTPELSYYQQWLLRQLCAATQPWCPTMPKERDALQALAEAGLAHDERRTDPHSLPHYVITDAGREWLAKRDKEMIR